MERIIVLAVCLICSFPLFIFSYFARINPDPIWFWSGDRSLKGKVKIV